MKVIRITAIWCMSCLVMRNRYDQLFKAHNINDIEDLDYDEDDLSPYNIGDILPIVIIEKDGREIKRIIGEKNRRELKKIFEEIIILAN
ncbi:MAG: thioredoxin domain-containing protein [Tenericutes bacterium]|jgi:thiol-disulfide isomerase/thioredoxin|nr:thioredoxin domain-containing protein [Mycoplasmatota bacterium]